MSERGQVLDVASAAPEWVLRRGDTLARLALVQVPGLRLFENLDSKRYDYAVATKDGMFIQIQVEAYSSRAGGVDGVDGAAELRWAVSAETVRRAVASVSPVLHLVFDADTDNGRFARLDTLPSPPRGAASVLVSFPAASVVDPANLANVIAELRASRRPPAESSAA